MIRLSKSVHHNEEVHIDEISDYGQRSGDQASHHVPPNFNQKPPIPSELADNIGDSNYWPVLVAELMKRIPQVPAETPPEEKIYDRTYNEVVLEEWIGKMENIFTVVAMLEEKKVNIRTYYLTGEADIWWNTIKDKFIGPEFT